MLTNTKITLKIVITSLTLVLLGVYAQHHGRIIDRETSQKNYNCVSKPQECINTMIVIRVRITKWTHDTIVAEPKFNNRYRSELPIAIYSLQGEHEVGRIIDILGYFDELGNYFVVKQREDGWIQKKQNIGV